MKIRVRVRVILGEGRGEGVEKSRGALRNYLTTFDSQQLATLQIFPQTFPMGGHCPPGTTSEMLKVLTNPVLNVDNTGMFFSHLSRGSQTGKWEFGEMSRGEFPDSFLLFYMPHGASRLTESSSAICR